MKNYIYIYIKYIQREGGREKTVLVDLSKETLWRQERERE
jgi:hypothetical protein